MIMRNLSNSFHSLYELLFQPTFKYSFIKKNDDFVQPLCTPDIHKSPSKPILQRQMTSLGRFAFRSQTADNPSVITFFVVLAHEADEDLNVKEFQGIWAKRVLDKHERFRCQISPGDDRFFEIVNNRPLDHHIMESQHPQGEFAKKIEETIISEMDATKGLWDVSLSCGNFGSSGAISTDPNHIKKGYDRETLALFRIHHSLCDGVSIAVAIGDLADEAAHLREDVVKNMLKLERNRNQNRAFYFFLLTSIISLIFMIRFTVACIYALTLQTWKMIVSSNPFDTVLLQSDLPSNRRSVSWENVASLDEIKLVAKRTSNRTTINDVACLMVTHAIKRQLEEHARNTCDGSIRVPQQVNITIPVHLRGGILRPGEQLGNHVGGFVSTIPLSIHQSELSSVRLHHISKILQREKALPSPVISWQLAKIFTRAPLKFCSFALKKFSANSVAVISNVKGFPIPVHWLGRKVQFLCAFLPLPPGIPIGVVISSYAGMVSFGINADKRAVPDANKFSTWMLEEYENIKNYN